MSITGTITGGNGGESITNSHGGTGGRGVVVGGTLSIVGTITAGVGGYSRYGTGGTGGECVAVYSDANLTVAGPIIGGAGGASRAMVGGDGGDGVVMGFSPTLVTTGPITGGTGGYSYSGTAGAGGAGANLSFNSESLTYTGPLTGGAGGYSRKGTGGAGGAGLLLGQEENFAAAGTIIGGMGGLSGYTGGTGGAGAAVTFGTLMTTGTILGGAGGSSHSGPSGVAGNGVNVAGGGKLINGNATHDGALIRGWIGVSVAYGTVTNYATIQGTSGTAISFTQAGDRLIAEAGSVFIGSVGGGGGTLELANGNGTITGLGATGTLSGAEMMTFSGFGSYLFDAGSSWTLAGIDALAARGTLAGAGTLDLAGTLTNSGTVGTDYVATSVQLISPTARLVAESGSIWLGRVEGGVGTLELAGGKGTITGLGATGTLSGAEMMTFSGFGALDLDSPSSWTLTGVNALAGPLTNAGDLIVGDKSVLTVEGSVDNNGVLEITRGHVRLEGAVTGHGTALINGGTLAAGSAFSQGVTFGTAGELKLARATRYTGSVSGFSKKGKTAFDLLDIGFVASSEATFSGTSSSGVLTVSDGTNTANIKLVGDYITTTFTAASDGHGGTIVTASIAPRTPAATHPFLSAMAGLGGSAGNVLHTGLSPPANRVILATPRAHIT